MSKRYLNPKQSIGVEPDAGDNVEAVGSCCLDVNAKPAYLVRGRVVGGVWFTIFAMMLMPAVITLIYVLWFAMREKAFVEAELMSVAFDAFWLSVLTDAILSIGLLYSIRIWRTHIPLRFNRSNLAVYYHHGGETYCSGWDNIRAYLRLQTYAGSGAVLHDPQVNIEFQRENGTIFTVRLLAKSRFGGYQDAAAFWEYIRVYMEEGPHKLPKIEEAFCDRYWQGCLNNDNLFKLFNSDMPLGKIGWLLYFPLFVPLIVLSYPTDYLYCRLVKRIKVQPFPLDMVDPCLTNETKKDKQDKRLAKIRSQIEQNQLTIKSVEQLLRSAYEQWFVDFNFPGHERIKVVDGVPEGWYQVALTDLVELNPGNSMETAEFWYVPACAIPVTGMLIERKKLERCTTPTSTTFRNGDTVFPRSSPSLDEKQAGFVEFLTHDGVACGSEEFIVMRGKRVGPEFTYCLATNRILREHAARNAVETAPPRVELRPLAEFALPMPPLALLEEFDGKYAKPSFQEIASLVAENERLRQAQELASVQ